ncbi:YitT family protein [Sphingomonas sp. Leaf17]|uniref:YitT family protein n=1 Tax=Sphingomonas sp. Leaf17 TaxID=1735683 RepID=UPI0009E8F00B|nr:YitT family protein [Sphingomonas sp. Leaf17]
MQYRTQTQPNIGPTAPAVPVTTPRPHSLWEDAYALVIGCILLVLGLVLLKQAGLVTGGVAGIALLLSYIIPLPAGVLFTIINIPFFLFAHKMMGARFAVKTVLVNVGIFSFSVLAKASVRVVDVHPAFAAIVGGTVIGFGILSLARHQAGVGGTGVITLWLQRTRGWNAGRTQMVLDIVILAAAIPVVSPSQLGWSVLSAGAISLMLMTWHRPGRYIGH